MNRGKPARAVRGLVLGLALLLVTSFLGASGEIAAEPDPKVAPWRDFWCCEVQPLPAWASDPTMPALADRVKRHRSFMQDGVPLEYRGRISPYPAARMVIDDGSRLYQEHCAACHGPKGLGDGEAGKDLTPSPALLAYLIERPMAVDEYLLWTISEGGVGFGSEMPAFKGSLSDREIWQIVAYLRAGLPAADQ